MSHRRSFICLMIVVILSFSWIKAIIAPPGTMAQSPPDTPVCLDYNPDLSQFNFNSEIPHDAYNANGQECANNNSPKPPQTKLDQIKLQSVYDIFSWRSFLAINWPLNEQGNPGAKISDAGLPQWINWKESYEVFKADGTEPSDWGAARTLPTAPELPPLTSIADPFDKTKNLLFEVKQANSNLPLWDQNGNMVYYEFLLSQEVFNDIKKFQLYNLQGQIDYYNAIELLEFPWGSITAPETGSIQLKLAWKILDQDDIPSRFFSMNAYVLDQNEWVPKTMGLVGMHIVHKTASSRKWVWSTFEQVDNVQVNNMEVLQYADAGQTLKPSFNNPYSETLAVNVLPQPDATGLMKTQVMRVSPIPEATADLNQQIQELLKQQGSVWQYYELVGTQYATDPNPLAPPATPAQGLPDILTNKSGGYPAPAYLINSVIETYFQKGNQELINAESDPLGNTTTLVFETQSCMGCHHSAELAVAWTNDQVFRLPGIADFSFRLYEAQSMQVLTTIPYSADIANQLDQQKDLPKELADAFAEKKVIASGAVVKVEKAKIDSITIPNKWLITVDQQNSQQKYIVSQEANVLEVYILAK